MKFCPNCGTKIEKQQDGCPSCGFKPSECIAPNKKISSSKGKNEIYDYYENKNYNYDTNSYVNIEENMDCKNGPSLSSKILLIIMVIFFYFLGAIVGIIVGGVFMAKNGEGYKSFGKKLLIISIIFLILDLAGMLVVIRMIGGLLYNAM